MKTHQITLKNVRLSKKSKSVLRKIKDDFHDNIANAIENSMWNISSDTYEFIDLKTSLESQLHEFFNLPKDAFVEIDCFDTGILSFEKGVYPRYTSK